MGNWKEKMREIEEAERQKIANQQAQVALKQQELKKEEELRSARNIAFNTQKKERDLRFFEIFDTLQVRKKLEEVKHQIWKDNGHIVEASGLGGFVRLAFEYNTTVPEIETKRREITIREGYEVTEYWGGHHYKVKGVDTSTKIVKQYKVIKPSYLEIGIHCSEEPYLYMLDTEVDLKSINEDKVFSTLEVKAGKRHFKDPEKIQYTDTNGNTFDKEPRPAHNSLLTTFSIGSEVSFSYSLVNSHYANYRSVGLPSEPDMKAMDDFINFGIALSCSLRTSQGKLPFQLK